MKQAVMIVVALWLVMGPLPAASPKSGGPLFAGESRGGNAYSDNPWTLRWREPRVRAVVRRRAPDPVAPPMPSYEAPAPTAPEPVTTLWPPEPAPPTLAAAPPPPATRTSYVLQIGAFRSYESARALQQRLSLHYPGVYLTKFQLRGIPFHRVRVGAFRTDTDLASTESSLRRDGYTTIRVRAGVEDL